MLTDPISDMLIRIKNAYMAGKHELVLPSSKMKLSIANILKNNHYINSVEEFGDKKKELRIKLSYQGKTPAMQDVKRISKPGRRIYVPANNLPRVLNDYGIAIISTSKGIMTNKEARRSKVGGEVICEIY